MFYFNARRKSALFGKRVVVSLVGALGLMVTVADAQTITSNQTGTNNGYYFSFWKQDNTGSVSMTLGSGGNYSTNWSGINNFTAGKGWSTGARRNINFSGSFNGGSNGYLAVYGWTTNPLIEYYIVENHGSWTPPGGTSLGTINSDGGTYNIYKMHRSNAPCITGNNCDFDQYWSVRTSTRSSGTVNTCTHFDAWASKGMNLGTFNYQILETEGYQSSGNSNVTVSDGGSCSGSSSSSSSSGGTGTITVRARGTGGGEQIQLLVNNSVVGQWTLTTSYQNYTVNNSATTNILVKFINDSTNHDVQVDYIIAGGQTKQAEDQTYNTGVYQNGACGGGNGHSEWLNCNGAIGF